MSTYCAEKAKKIEDKKQKSTWGFLSKTKYKLNIFKFFQDSKLFLKISFFSVVNTYTHMRDEFESYN